MGSWSFKAAPFLLLGNYERPLQHAKRTHTLQTPLISGEAVKALPRDPLTGLEPSCTRGEEGLEEQLRSTETTDSIHRRVSPVQEGEGGSHLDSSFRQPCSAREQRHATKCRHPVLKAALIVLPAGLGDGSRRDRGSSLPSPDVRSCGHISLLRSLHHL